MKRKATCYMCDSDEVSREHAPPSCFFPEASTFGKDLRKNLVTVPSCDAHNSKKSMDDEFFRATLLLTTAQHSEASKHQFFQKLLAASARRPGAHGAFFEDKGTIASGTQRVVRIDRPRFDKCLDHLTRALFFDAFRRKWLLPIVLASPNLYSGVQDDNVSIHGPSMQAVGASKAFLAAEPIRGENPEVFKYRLRFDETAESFAFAGQFYDLFEIYSYSSRAMLTQADGKA